MRDIATITSELTPVEKNFCHFVVADPKQDHIEAYLKINPALQRKTAATRGKKLLKKPEVAVYIEHLMVERQKRLEMDEDWVMMKLRDIHDRCTQAVPVWDDRKRYEYDSETGETVEAEPSYYKFDATGAIKALELIGRHMRMFSDKIDTAHMSVGVNINLGGDHPKIIEGKFERVGKG